MIALEIEQMKDSMLLYFYSHYTYYLECSNYDYKIFIEFQDLC